ncbi:MAG: hypothetical protein K9I94_08260 [Bacteroidales bacterium]|nr:hypothetical protein [Bacteroidales bacterium]
MVTYQYNNLGNVYNSIPGKTDSAVYYLKKAIKVSEKGSKFGSKLSAYINLGNVYFEKEPEKALAWYTKAREMPLFEQGLYQKAGVIINMGGVNIDLGNLDTAKSLLYNGIRYARRGGYLNFERNAYESLIRIDSIRENIDSAMAHFNKVRQLSDSIKNENIRNRVSELEIEYETEKMEAENEQLKKENRLNQQLIQKQNYIVIISISASLILILFIIWIYISNRRVKRLNQQLEEQNQELEKLNNTKDKFFSIVAHDLKSPFNTLIGFLEELHDNYDEFTDEEKRKIIKDLKTSSENAYKMLVNLLDWARSQRGKIEIKPREIKVRNFVNEELAYVKERAGGKTQDFRNEIPETLSVYADPTMTSTVLANLINNAIKFTPRGGSIILSGSRNNGNAQILVKDTGTGIPPEKQQNLFDPGSEFRQQGTEDEKGTGLGLIICKEFINKMNGNIGVRSKPGEGSTFYFTLPAEKGKSDSQKVT